MVKKKYVLRYVEKLFFKNKILCDKYWSMLNKVGDEYYVIYI